MSQKKKIYKTRNKKRKNTYKTKKIYKKYNMKKKYGGQENVGQVKNIPKPINTFQEKVTQQKEKFAKSVSNVYSNLSGNKNENEQKLKTNESEIEKLKKEKETANDQRKNEINENILKLQEENEKIEKLTKFDVSKGLQNLGKGVGNIGKGLFDSFKPKKEFNDQEKQQIIQKLKLMTQKKELTENELTYLIDYLNKPPLIPSTNNISESFKGLANMMTPTEQPMPVNSESTITAAMVPNYYEGYSKTSIPTNDKLKISENIYLINESKSNISNFVSSNLNSVDNFLAIVLNECSGSGCSSGQLANYKTENRITVSDNSEIVDQQKNK